MKRWSFAKYAGCGNDFILFDNRQGTFPLSSSLIRRLCQRQIGVGADGLLLLENSAKADFRVRIFNSDGSEAEMCGNGIRCLVKWLINMGVSSPLRIEVMQDVLIAQQTDDHAICVEIGSPHNIQWDIPLRFENRFLRIHYLNTGVPHAVLFTDDIEKINLLKLGAYIRHYSLWTPNGTNVNIAQVIKNQKLKIRSYERGIEGETLACGTGAMAAALAAAHQYHFSSPVIIETRSGEELQIHFSFENHKFSRVALIGPAKCIFLGEIDLEERQCASASEFSLSIIG